MKKIAIVGSGRSGTTYLSKVFRQLPVHFGEVGMYEESKGARRINDPIIARECGATPGQMPYGTPFTDIKLTAEDYAKKDMFFYQMEEEAKEAGKEYFIFKDPRTTLLYDLYDDVDIFIGMIRKPIEVINSYIGHGFIKQEPKKENMTKYWYWFNSSMLKIAKEAKSFYLIDFNSDINRQVDTLLNELDFSPVNDVYNASEKHYNSNDESISEEVDELYKTLLGLRLC